MSKLVLIKLPGNDQGTAHKPLPTITWTRPQLSKSSLNENDKLTEVEPGMESRERSSPLAPDYFI